MTSHSFPPFPKEAPRLDSVRPLEKHYSVILPTVSHSSFVYKTASAGKLLQDRRAREGGCQDPALAMAFWHGGRAREARAGQAGGPPRAQMHSGLVTLQGVLGVG